jgi:hypothetical protein
MIEVVEELGSAIGLSEAERFWISQFRAWGFRLTNLTNGGEGAASLRSEDHKRKISIALKGRALSEETVRKLKDVARKRDATHYSKGVASRKERSGYSPTQATKDKISASMRQVRASQRCGLIRP